MTATASSEFPKLPGPHCRCGKKMELSGIVGVYLCETCDRGWQRQPPRPGPPELPTLPKLPALPPPFPENADTPTDHQEPQ